MVAGNGLNNVLGMLIPNGTSLRTGTESETDPVRDVLMEALLTLFVDVTFLGKTDQGTHTLYQFLYDSIDSTKSDQIGIANHDVETAVWNAIETVTELASLNITDHKDLVISIEGKEVAHPELRTIHINSDDFESGELYPPYMNRETDNATRNTVNFYTILKPGEVVSLYTMDTTPEVIDRVTYVRLYTSNLISDTEDKRTFEIEGGKVILEEYNPKNFYLGVLNGDDDDDDGDDELEDGEEPYNIIHNNTQTEMQLLFAVGYRDDIIPFDKGSILVKSFKYEMKHISMLGNDPEYTHVEINSDRDTVKENIAIKRGPGMWNSIESGPSLLWYIMSPLSNKLNDQDILDVPLDKYMHFYKVRQNDFFRTINLFEDNEFTIPIIMRTTEGEVYRLELYYWESGKASYYRKKIGDVSPVPDFDYAGSGYTYYDTRQNATKIDVIIPGVLELRRSAELYNNSSAIASVSFFRPVDNLTISDEDILNKVDTLNFSEDLVSDEYDWIPNKTIGSITLHERYGGTLVLCKVEHGENIDYYSLRFSYWKSGGGGVGGKEDFAYWRKKLN